MSRPSLNECFQTEPPFPSSADVVLSHHPAHLLAKIANDLADCSVSHAKYKDRQDRKSQRNFYPVSRPEGKGEKAELMREEINGDVTDQKTGRAEIT